MHSPRGFPTRARTRSPRGAGVEGEDEDWDFGTGAGFYVNATTEKWAKHYNMYDYVTKVRLTLSVSRLD